MKPFKFKAIKLYYGYNTPSKFLVQYCLQAQRKLPLFEHQEILRVADSISH